MLFDLGFLRPISIFPSLSNRGATWQILIQTKRDPSNWKSREYGIRALPLPGRARLLAREPAGARRLLRGSVSQTDVGGGVGGNGIASS